jgi:hypothetical protein
MPEDTYRLTADGLRDLMKIGARETARILEEREALLKFAMAVEILPKLEKSGVVKFPLDLSMHKKAWKLAEKPMEELHKLAYVADHVPSVMRQSEREIEGEKTASSGAGELTTRFMDLNRD